MTNRKNQELNNQQQSSQLQQLKLEQLDYVAGGRKILIDTRHNLVADADSETFDR